MKSLTLVGLLISLVSCSGGKNSTGYSVINDMKYSVAYEAFTEANIFDNGQMMQAAPKNTIARGWLPHPSDDNGEPIEFDKNPFVYDEFAQHRGKLLYEAHCISCHGAEGKGDGLVVTKGGFPAPPSFQGRAWRRTTQGRDGKDKYAYSQGWIYNIITFGRGNMSSYAQQLYPEDRWAVSEYVRRELGRRSNSMPY